MTLRPTPAFTVTDDTQTSEVTEALAHLCARARREFPVVGTGEHPTPWDIVHRQIDEALDDWERLATGALG